MDAELRPLATDRPDTTESPYSVPAGHVQVEMSFVDVTRDEAATAIAVAPINAKLGLASFSDLQVGFDPVVLGGGEVGVGDVVVRLKLNAWGNDEGDTALAVMPFVKVPSASPAFGNGRVEGGVIVPIAIALPNDFGLGVMPELDLVATDDGYAVDLVHTITCSHALAGPVAAYLEYAGFAGGGEPYRGYADGGLTLGVGDDVQFDAGTRIGLTSASEDVAGFVGVSFRR